MMCHKPIGLFLITLMIMAREALAAPPTLTHVFPPGGQRGTTATVTGSGSFSWPVQVWAPGIEVAVGEESGKLTLNIPADLAADRVWVRLYNKEGISAPYPFLIGNLLEIVEQEPNNSLPEAQQLKDNRTAVNGVLQQNGDVDGFAIPLEAGQTLVASVDANGKLGSPMDAILQITSADGTVMASNHDDVGLDPLIAYTARQSGIHVVRIFAFPESPDTGIAFRGGADYIYRLNLTTGPFVTHTVPLAAPQSDPGSVEIRGWNIAENSRVAVVPLGGARLSDRPEFEAFTDLRNPSNAQLGFAFSPELSGSLRVRLTPCPVVAALAEASAENPLQLTAPTCVTGWIKAARQTDVYRVPFSKGVPNVIAVESRSLGLHLHPVVQLLDAAGAVIASSEPTEPMDVVLSFTAPQDGDYLLKVSDRYRQGGPRCFYRLTVRQEQTDFDLVCATDAVVVTREKPAEFTVTVQRRTGLEGAPGPITIEPVGLPPGVTAAAVVSDPSGATAASVTLSFSAAGPSFSGPIRILGKTSTPKEIQHYARTPARQGSSGEEIWLTVGE